MKRAHAMPFGAEYRGGETRFRLWAPACETVELVLGREAGRAVRMDAQDAGWHEAIVRGVRPGEAYAFRVGADKPLVPDPASRYQPWDVNGPSAVVDPNAHTWRDGDWRGRRWSEAVVYEVHVGTFTPEGTFAAAIARLDYLADLGVTALELMPLADFAGRRNWGYDGVLPYAPDASYGTPEDLKRLIEEAHARGLMVLLDVVYNHFGPEGNYLSLYAPQFFNPAHQTPWGAAINFDGECCRPVRDYYVHNALYWLEEYHFDGLRMDAVHAIADESDRHIVLEIAEQIARGPGRDRFIHQVLENEDHRSSLLLRGGIHATAQWADDFHHGAHVRLTGESDGYYGDYADRPLWHLGRALAEGFSYQGDFNAPRSGKPRGEPSASLPPEAFVLCLQNHDQVGNRAMGERIFALAEPDRMRLAMAILCLAPPVPMLFMGDEFAAATPFLFFCDFSGDLADAVREGRRREFAHFPQFNDPAERSRIPDPNGDETFEASKLDWDSLTQQPHARFHALIRHLLDVRRREIVPRLGDCPVQGRFEADEAGPLALDWTLADGSRLHLRANLGGNDVVMPRAPGRELHREGPPRAGDTMRPWSGEWTLEG